MSANEIALLVVGILVDILIIIILFLISVCKFNDEIRFWYDSKMRETMPPYKKVADYLRGMEHESGGFKKREPSYSSSVSEMEPAYELLEERPTIVSAHERDRSLKSSHSGYTSPMRTFGIEQGDERKPAASLVHFYRSPSVRSPHHSLDLSQHEAPYHRGSEISPSKEKPQVARKARPRPPRRRGRTRRHPSSSAFLPISRAQWRERLLYKSDSGSSSPSGIKMRRVTAAPEICQTRTMPSWDPKKK
ncbi:hypothetical protein T265_08260 [Opisthorchis viverrini]|uniref:Uncharacterized protein n=1 Tax=Opisthorchis viverrini TaxID=6198 RepID=A0A074ZE79_OPIVI|nr:hypothetical protein T265_08260 [Opisthorchis viverrini]KER23962.1 hypothetical protein T265_08260 [Opisthorchis viverrini]